MHSCKQSAQHAGLGRRQCSSSNLAGSEDGREIWKHLIVGITSTPRRTTLPGMSCHVSAAQGWTATRDICALLDIGIRKAAVQATDTTCGAETFLA